MTCNERSASLVSGPGEKGDVLCSETGAAKKAASAQSAPRVARCWRAARAVPIDRNRCPLQNKARSPHHYQRNLNHNTSLHASSTHNLHTDHTTVAQHSEQRRLRDPSWAPWSAPGSHSRSRKLCSNQDSILGLPADRSRHCVRRQGPLKTRTQQVLLCALSSLPGCSPITMARRSQQSEAVPTNQPPPFLTKT